MELSVPVLRRQTGLKCCAGADAGSFHTALPPHNSKGCCEPTAPPGFDRSYRHSGLFVSAQHHLTLNI